MTGATAPRWPKRRLGELAEFRNGINYSKRNFGAGMKVVGVSDFQDFTRPRFEELEEVDPTGIVTDRNLLRDGDIVFVRSNGNRELIGRSLLIERPPCDVTHSGFTIRLRFSSHDVEPTFYAYLFRTPLIRASLTAHGGGTNISNLNQDILDALVVPVPPRRDQERIAAALTAYDELIDNNLRRIRILEEMARALYREWFVHFRFRGRERRPIVDSGRGPLPAGWERRQLAELVTTQYGYTESASTDQIGPQYLRGMDINKTGYIDWSAVPYCEIDADELPAYRLHRGDVVVIRMADPGKPGIIEQDVEAVFASYLIRVVPKTDRLLPQFLFHLLGSVAYQNFVRGASTGTTRKSASAGVLTDFEFVLPPAHVVAAFEERAGAIRALLTNLVQQNATLRRARDLALPRLIDGRIALDGVDSAA